ncbi:cupredoxin domain-containing protein [Candidatus Leptofilum sp.]|uniref:cupredoxin domain-containing protein n=1 Tax=Candidatus Leptofilum sp. TaxID=3241576 RepID=UPI003B5A7ED1
MFRKKLFFLFLILLFAFAACADESDEPDVTATAVPQEAAVNPTTPPTEPTAVPTELPAAADPTLPPTATAVPVVEAEPAPQRFGVLRFRDSDSAPAGSFQLLLEGITAPAAGTHYELWLVDDSFNTLNLGPFEVADGNVQFSGSVEQNLLAAYSSAFISVEPNDVDDGEIGTIALNGTVPAGSLLHIRHVVTAFAGNPDGSAFLIGAQGQIHHAMEHTGFLLDELANDNIREAQRHAEHVINILDGEAGPNFGDLDGDTVAQNPGDGFGVIPYLNGAKEHTNLALAADGVTAEVELHAGHVLISSDNALSRLDDAISEALRIIASDSATEAQPAAEELAALLDAALNGVDANGDGAVAPIPDEGGIITAYVHGQNMASFEFFAAEGANVAAAPAEEAPEAEAAATEAAPTVEAVPTEAPAAAAPVVIEMANFAYVPNEITVEAGTAVTWVNKDSGPRHSATAADGSFDTGLFDEGEEVTLTFDAPGTYIYYCTLHGSPDGSGMAATITVTE